MQVVQNSLREDLEELQQPLNSWSQRMRCREHQAALSSKQMNSNYREWHATRSKETGCELHVQEKMER